MATENRKTNASELSTANSIARLHAIYNMNIPVSRCRPTDLVHEAYLRMWERTIKRDWNVAKAWLRPELSRGGAEE